MICKNTLEKLEMIQQEAGFDDIKKYQIYDLLNINQSVDIIFDEVEFTFTIQTIGASPKPKLTFNGLDKDDMIKAVIRQSELTLYNDFEKEYGKQEESLVV